MNSILKKIVWLVMAAPAVYLAFVWNKLPERVALHFDLKGNPDRFGNKSELITLILILAVVNALLYLILTNIYRIDPKKYAAENRDRLFKLAFATVALFSCIMCLIIYSGSRGNIKFGTGLIFSGTGLFFAIIGNYLPNLKPNYFAGLRLPWTLENEENWRKTHLLAGKLWFAGGLFLAVVCLFLPPVAAIVAFFTVMTIIVLIPCVYSYRLYKQQKNIS
ncbi:MAG: SdpI family protein [Bacteroidota bacterium]